MNGGRCSNMVNSVPVAVNLVQNSCFSQSCFSVNLAFIKSTEGLIKLAQILLGASCQKLLIGYGFTYATTLGSSYYSFLATVSASVLTSLALLFSYLLSHRSFQLVRQSLFEIIFNAISSLLYLSSSCYLAFAVYTFLYPIYKITSMFQLYPEMSITYIIGLIAGILHGYDGWLAYKNHI